LTSLESIRLSSLKSIGAKREQAFGNAGFHSVLDLLLHYPTRYIDRSTIVSIEEATDYADSGFQGELTIIAQVLTSTIRYGKRGRMLLVRFGDSSGEFSCLWFNGIKFFEKKFHSGDTYAISGKPILDSKGELSFSHPDLDFLSAEDSGAFYNTGKIIPFYSIPPEIREMNLGDNSFRRLIHSVVEQYADQFEETLSDEICSKHKLLPISQTIRELHFPSSQENLLQAGRRAAFEEIFYYELLLAMKKNSRICLEEGDALLPDPNILSSFIHSLPFTITQSQKKVIDDILKDIGTATPMNRLLQGDVGSGKTVVAVVALLAAVSSGYQGVLVAPTEVLASQHYHRINQLFETFAVITGKKTPTVSLLTGSISKKEKTARKSAIEQTETDIVIGTHALFEENVVFNKLGLVVVDEQHRFGVMQRLRVITKGKHPHVLIMSATPIPRTLSMMLYGDLDISIINELPKGRKPVSTSLFAHEKQHTLFKRVAEKSKEGIQSFIVYPLVEESDKIQLKAAVTEYERLIQSELKDIPTGLLHGAMKWKEKEEIMRKFAAKELMVLVSTTVIEVGVDIPDAGIIIIMEAQRFGLAQLHQLRGRVGRSSLQAFCVLVTSDKIISQSKGITTDVRLIPQARRERYKSAIRLATMVNSSDGFFIAEQDFVLRGPGDIFSTKQSGMPEFRHIDFIKDTQLIYEAKTSAFSLVESDPQLMSQPLLKHHITLRFKNELTLSGIA